MYGSARITTSLLFNCIKLSGKCVQRDNQLNINCITSITQMRKYDTWYHRRPSKIVNEEEILQHAEEATGPYEFIDGNNSNRKRRDNKALKIRPKKKQLRKKLQVTPNDSRLRDDGSLNITELKEDDTLLTTLMMSVRSKKTRDKNSKILLEGRRLIEDALDSGAIPEIIVFSRTPDAMQLPLPEKGVKLFKVPYRAIRTWSTLVTPPGIMGFFQIPDVENKIPASDSLPLTIICDNVRDPGNLGSILRAAAAVGCKKLITLVGCVDIWEPKVLKTAAGCHFRMPIFASKTWEDVSKLIDPFANIYVADNNTLTDEAKLTDRVSNESVDIIDDDDASCEINENKDDDESFDKRNVNIIKSDEKIEELNDDNDDDESKKPKTNYQRIVESKVAKKLTSNVPVIPYYSTDYTSNENIIIIGGETLGLSIEALKMVSEKYGVRVNIPMTNGVDSLNTGMALGIIAFEMRKQYVLAKKIEQK